jgi:non-lysosomal glucosylceramidase
MSDSFKADRRDFLKQAAGALGAATQTGHWSTTAEAQQLHETGTQSDHVRKGAEGFPRRFEGRQLRMIAFPLGGVAAGSISLGGRGQLCDWEIFNRPNKGYRPLYSFPAIWAQAAGSAPVTRVLESRIQPPYQGYEGLGSGNVPGLSRLESATFIGAYPLAHIDFHDSSLPVQVQLDAFSPFIPHDPDDSGLPVAMLHYRVTNPGSVTVKASIAFSIENPVQAAPTGDNHAAATETRPNEYRTGKNLAGLYMSNPAVSATDPMHGSFALAALPDANIEISHWSGWPEGRWWNGPLLFWDQFSREGRLGAQPEPHNAVGALCLQATIAPGRTADFRFLLGWHFPNRTPQWCDWEAPPGEGKTVIGNYYATRFADAWQAVSYAAEHWESLESRTKAFASAFKDSTLPAEIKEAASANLSTLATNTCFRTADGEFHGFEGSGDKSGLGFGNCTHVWNYETATAFLFPSFARSLRRSAFGYSMDEAGAMHFRQVLPDGKTRSYNAAADGQMGQIVHAWLDWKLSGDMEWLRAFWPRIKKAIEFAWVPGGWDSNRDGVLEGVQHNTYDVEFYGPNPMCGIYYLAALRACAEMADAVGDSASSRQYQSLFEQGRHWTDSNLFNGEYYVQKIRSFRAAEIAPSLRGGMGAENSETPEFQVGEGCLVDQLVGQYLADVGRMEPLVSPDNIRKTLASVYKYNARPSLAHHDNVARTYALNDEAAIVICDYAKAERPRIPFPYFSETWSGLEYTLASLMISWGMVREGIEIVRNTRLRYDGEKRNPWDEAEYGHHYARAMASWSMFVALSGFGYDGVKSSIVAVPRIPHDHFDCFWATATSWGTFSYRSSKTAVHFTLSVITGSLQCRSCEITTTGQSATVRRGETILPNSVESHNSLAVVNLQQPIVLVAGEKLEIEIHA